MSHITKYALAGLTCAVVAACGGGDRREPAPVVYRNAPATSGQLAPSPAPSPAIQSNVAPAAAPAPVPSGQADGRGVVYYDGYETIRARRGDGVSDMAARVGMSGAELAAYNGLSTQYAPQEGDELVLPARADRNQGTIAAAPRPVAVAAAPQSSSSFPSGYTPSVSAPGGQASAAAPQPVQPAPAAGTTGWSADLARAAIGGSEAPAPAPQSSAARSSIPAEPLPPAQPRLVSPEQQPAAVPVEPAPQPQVQEVASATPQPAPLQTSVSSSARFIKPTTAPIALPFSKSAGADRNDGVDFATRAGDPVAAADDGTVALISKSLGGLGTIILVRHENEFLTVYGRVDNVTVRKGDRVGRGQIIAQVADLTAPRNPYLHFEVRRGAESVDPQQYF